METHRGVYAMNAKTILRVFIASFAWRASTKILKKTSMTQRCVSPVTATLMERFRSATPATPPVPAWSTKGRFPASATVRRMSEDGSATIVHQVLLTLV